MSVENGKIEVVFDEAALKDYRFDPVVSYNHFTYHIKPSRDYFLRTKDERKTRVGRYKRYPSREA